MPRFSIVIPAYNVEAYLEQCLDSLLAQTFGDWEAVVVDDASPDGSGALADRLAASDPRITVVHKAANEGTHLARRTGMERCCGEYTVFLDGDDSLKPDCLALLDEALSADPVDSIHYGLVAQAAGSTSDEAAKAFERFNNEGEGTLARQELLTQVFFERGGYRRDWRVTNHAYKTEALKRAFEAMTPERLDRAEDAYEYLVICSVIEQEATRNDILGYVYNLGRGIINYDRLTPEAYAREAAQCQACIDASVDFARMSGDEALAEAASGAKVKLAEIVTNDWQNRVAPEDQAKAAELIASVLGPNEVAANLARLARDGAYRLWDTDVSLADDPSVERTFNLALELSDTAHVADDARARLDAAVVAAASHIGDLRRRDAERAERDLLADYDAQKVRILVSAHRDFARFDAKSLQMIQVGCAVNGGRLPDMLHDDEGDNDSGLNKMLCEMTAQYWAWKHVTDAEYVGFCHYRRYFNFSDTRYEENGWGEVMAGTIDEAAQRRFGLDDASIARAIEGYDIVTAPMQDIRSLPAPYTTPAEQYADAPKLHIDDLILCGEVVKELHPDYAQDVDAYLNGHTSCFCNMYIMRTELFREYAEWVFPILDRCIDAIDFSHYSVEGVRTPGHLAERLLNIYLIHGERVGRGWKTKELQVVHFQDPAPRPAPRPLPLETPVRSTIPVVFAADNNYVPMVSTTIVSMLENADPAYRYDVIVLTSDISGENRAEMGAVVARYPHAHLRFLDVADIVEKYDLTTSNAHISNETYYRFLIQELLPFYTKVLYLDSDLVVTGDVAELYHTDVTGNLLAAARDVDFLGNLNMPDGKRMAYAEDVLGMRDPYDYFQAGVLLLNTGEMRQFMSMEQWLEAASDPTLIYNDQDVLNRCCEGRVTYLDNAWNVMIDCDGRIGRIFSFAPAPVFDAFLRARGNALVTHYAGFQKPWTMVGCDKAELYWEYARKTPFYERLIAQLAAAVAHVDLGGKRISWQPPKAIGENNPIRKLVDPIMPYGTRRREVMKSIGRTVRGLN